MANISPNIGWFEAIKQFNKLIAVGGGTKNSASTITVSEETGAKKITLTLKNHVVSTTDATTNGAYGSVKLYTFPAKNITFLSGSASLTLAKQGAGLADAAAIVYSLGTVAAAADATLTGTEANFIASTAATLTAGVTPAAVKGKSVTAAIATYDGEAAAKDVFLNFATNDAGSTANDALIVNGTVTISWSEA